MSVIESLRILDWSSLREMNWQLLVVRLYTVMSNVFDALSKQSLKSGKYLLRSFAEETYYYLDGSFVAVPGSKMNPNKNACDPQFSYKYVVDSKTIYSLTGSTDNHEKHTSNLIEVRLFVDGSNGYDLTDFFDTVEFVSAKKEDFPPVLAWIAFWSMESGNYLDPNLDWKLKVTTIEGEDEVFTVFSKSDDSLARWKYLNTPMTLTRISASVAVEAPVTGPNPVTESQIVESTHAVVEAPVPVVEAPVPVVESATLLETQVEESKVQETPVEATGEN